MIETNLCVKIHSYTLVAENDTEIGMIGSVNSRILQITNGVSYKQF